MMTKSRKPRRETRNNITNVFRDAAKGIADSAFFDDFASLPERYKRDDVRIHMHVRGELTEFCAIFQYHDRKGLMGNGASFRIPQASGYKSRLCSNHLYKPMLVSVVYFMEHPQEVSASASTALVWLQPLNECLMFRFDTVQHSSALPMELREAIAVFVLPFRATNEKNRELGAGCRCLFVIENQLIDKAIKGRTEIMGDFSDVDSPIQRRRAAIYVYAVHIFSALRIELRLDDVILGITPEGFLHPSESVDFTYCTPYLEARAIKLMYDYATFLSDSDCSEYIADTADATTESVDR
jgi:hypothetical protein